MPYMSSELLEHERQSCDRSPILLNLANNEWLKGKIFQGIDVILYYKDHILSFASLAPVTRYRSIYRNRSVGLVCPLVSSIDNCELVRLYICKM